MSRETDYSEQIQNFLQFSSQSHDVRTPGQDNMSRTSTPPEEMVQQGYSQQQQMQMLLEQHQQMHAARDLEHKKHLRIVQEELMRQAQKQQQLQAEAMAQIMLKEHASQQGIITVPCMVPSIPQPISTVSNIPPPIDMSTGQSSHVPHLAVTTQETPFTMQTTISSANELVYTPSSVTVIQPVAPEITQVQSDEVQQAISLQSNSEQDNQNSSIQQGMTLPSAITPSTILPATSVVNNSVNSTQGGRESIIAEQKKELHEMRMAASAINPKPSEFPSSSSQNETESLEANENERTSPYSRSHLLSLLNKTLVQFCHDHLVFVEFAHITGRFSFNLDNRETMHLVVSQMAKPQGFSEKPKTKPNITFKTPRKRGRNSKAAFNPQAAPIEVSPIASGSGRKAAAKAKEKLNVIATMHLDSDDEAPYINPAIIHDPHDDASSDEDSDNDDDGPNAESDEEYIPDAPIEIKLEKVSKRTRKSLSADGAKDDNAEDEDISENGESILLKIKKEVLAKEYSGVADDDQADAPADDEGQGDAEADGIEDGDVEDTDDEGSSPKKRPKGKFACTKCRRTFMSDESLQKHIENHPFLQCVESDCSSLKFYVRGDIRKHFRDVHGKSAKQLHRCKAKGCNQEFVSRESLKRHQQTHVYICSVCGENFSTKPLLKAHKDTNHLELSCTICGRNFLSKGAFNRHMRRHKDKAAGKIKCDQCAKEFSSESSLFHHNRAAHKGIKAYHCHQCGMSFNFNNSLKLHLLKHSGDRPYQCDICHKSYLTANHLKNHVRAVHSNTKAFVCPICDKRFPYDNSLKLHMRLHTGDRPHMCSMCSKTFVSRSALKVHEACHVDSKNYECDICHKKYKTEMLLHNHQRRHTEDGSRYMCDICGNTYMYKSNLEVHYEVHGEKRNHECNICHKTFKTYPTLYSHYLVHSDKNPYECSQCGKAFKTKERLKAHEVRHTGLKPFSCDSCGSTFPDKGGLSKHKKTVHAEQPRFACPVCGKPCNRADNLRVHMKVHNDPSLLKLSFDDLKAKSSQPHAINHSEDSVTDAPETALPVIQAKQESETGISLHTLEAAKSLESLRLPQINRETYTEDRNQTIAPTTTQPSREVYSQVAATTPFMHWGPEGAMHYQSLLLSQGYPTMGVPQAQVQTGDNTQIPTVVYQISAQQQQQQQQQQASTHNQNHY